MNSPLRHATGSALVALALFAVPAAAQERAGQAEPQRPAATPPAGEAQRQQAPPQRPEPSGERPSGERPAAGAPQGQPQRNDAAARGGMNPDEVFRKMALEETKHRERMAKLQRLHELAQQQNQAERQAQIKDLVRQENERYAALRERGRKMVGDDAFNAAEARLAKGRTRAQVAQHQERREDAAGKPGERPAAQPPQRPEGERKPAQGERKPDAKPEGERKPQQGERPKGDGNGRGPQGGGNQAQRGDKPRGR